jgi:thiol:disulfide interchange protein DsbD
VTLALSMFGFFVLQLPASITRRFEAGEKGGFLEAAFMGLAMGFVAAPCVGPFAGSILVFVARSGDLVTGFLTLFSFGLGMGVLFVVLAVSSGSLAALPRSGGWLLKLEHFFGYVMLGMALYLLSNVVPPWFSLWAVGVYLVLGGAYLGAFSPVTADAGGWDLMGKGVGFLGVLMGAAAVLAGLAGAGFLGDLPALVPPGVGGAVASHEAGWVRSMDEALAQARTTGQPVFADFYADWCIPCTQMDKNVFPVPAVVAALRPFVRAKLDCTESESPGARYKNEVLKATSMPYLAFFDPEGRHLPQDSIEGYTDEAALVAALTKVSARYAPAVAGR